MKAARRVHRPAALEQFRLGKSLAAAGEREKAAAAYLAALEVEPDFAEALVNLGALYGQLPGHRDEAIACLQRAVSLNPQSARAHYNLGVILAKRPAGIDLAIASFETAVSIDPGHRNALYALAVQWNKKGDPVKSAIYHQYYQEAMTGKRAAPATRGAGDAVRGLLTLRPDGLRLRPLLRLRFRR